MVDTKTSSYRQDNQNPPYFTEVQRFRQTWIWVLLGALLGTLLFLGILQVVQHQLSGTHWLSTPALLFIGGIWGLLVLIAYKAHMFTKIDEEGVTFQLFPLQWSPRRIPWADIEEMYIRDYDGIAEYGGWGMRYGLQGKSYTISGRFGLQLHLSDDQQILIGTQRPVELEKLILRLRCNRKL
ncbi:MAG: hypothetical protein AAF992_00925 [Bacteroidota bacterium]